MIKNILIDLDGTLTDPKEGITTSARYGLSKVGHPISDEENIDWIIGPPLKASLAKILGVDVQNELAEAALLGYRERFAEIGLFENLLFDDVPETLKQLKHQGYRLYLATAKPEVYAKRILEHFGILEFFNYAYGSELNGDRTNKGDLIGFILEQEQLDPYECIMVGDREHDIFGAGRHGIETIAVSYGYGTPEEFDQAKPKYLIHHFSEIFNVLKDN